MSIEMVYLIACLAITMGAYYAAYLFARKDELTYAICFFLVASGSFYGAASVIRDPTPAKPRAEMTNPIVPSQPDPK
ncbi:hypothetical protein MPOCJGCO_3734 [Methylobacterium trifolii]|uniref:Uncharacterized protein n=1 Tax=Methylobacterium trifolii TaxID=1003092 RepID=A0ABQ4U5E5_9HYPH|nr:hypothetical protein MPOCJGCO_3734 [Methylobacterium trifolii]